MSKLLFDISYRPYSIRRCLITLAVCFETELIYRALLTENFFVQVSCFEGRINRAVFKLIGKDTIRNREIDAVDDNREQNVTTLFQKRCENVIQITISVVLKCMKH